MSSRSSMPAATVEVRGCSGSRADPRSADRHGAGLVPAAHPGADPDRSGVLRRARDRARCSRPSRWGGWPGSSRRSPSLPVERRPVDLYAALAEVAR